MTLDEVKTSASPAMHFSMHGSDASGWRLMVYKAAGQGGAVTPHLSEPKLFDTFQELLGELLTEYEGQGV